MEKENSYEKYSKWFDIIERKCNEENLQETLGNISYYNSFSGCKHYLLDNGLHVYKKEDNSTVISNEELSSSNEYGNFAITMTREKESRSKRGNLQGKNAITMSGNAAFVHYRDIQNSKKDLAYYNNVREYSPENKIVCYKMLGEDVPKDISQILEDAMEKAENDETRQGYENVLEFYNEISELVRGEKDNTQMLGKQENLQGEQELSNLSTDELEAVLQKMEESNQVKREELKRKELIAKIRAAQREGEELDAKLGENMRTEDGRE